mmetsp:Transcript_32059/g.73220  ORF Transcript_32059/g.73220 Transcript_32059/m.73220 type:complete len:222 (+) Transcript_32059:34-699(+)
MAATECHASSAEVDGANKTKWLEAISRDHQHFVFVPAALRADKDFVQRAIEHHPEALCHAHANLRADAEVVLKAVERDGYVLRFAHRDLCYDQRILITAVANDARALELAPPGIFSDADLQSFAAHASDMYILRVSMLSARSCIVVCHEDDMGYIVSYRAGIYLGICFSKRMRFLLGGEIVNEDEHVRDWTGLSLGKVNDLMLVLLSPGEESIDDLGRAND